MGWKPNVPAVPQEPASEDPGNLGALQHAPRGPDHGKLQGLETVDPHIVTTDGTVLLVSLLGRDHRSGEPQWFDTAKHARPTSAESHWSIDRSEAQKLLGFPRGKLTTNGKTIELPVNMLIDPDFTAFDIGVLALVGTALVNHRGSLTSNQLVDLANTWGTPTGLGFGDAGSFFDSAERLIECGYLPNDGVDVDSARTLAIPSW